MSYGSLSEDEIKGVVGGPTGADDGVFVGAENWSDNAAGDISDGVIAGTAGTDREHGDGVDLMTRRWLRASRMKATWRKMSKTLAVHSSV